MFLRLKSGKFHIDPYKLGKYYVCSYKVVKNIKYTINYHFTLIFLKLKNFIILFFTHLIVRLSAIERTKEWRQRFSSLANH